MDRRRAALLLLPLIAGACTVQQVAQSRVQEAAVAAGLSPPVAQCLARRIAGQLTARQLRRLAGLRPLGRSGDAYLAALQRLGDPELLRVTLSSAGLCLTGVAR